MGSLVFSLLAAGCSALSSLFFRKNTDCTNAQSGASRYLTFFYVWSLILSLQFSQGLFSQHVNWIVLSIGACVGLFSSTLMQLTGHALKHGPAGMTFAFQNASAIFPGLILFLLLGSDFGYSCSYLQLAGMICVLAGLFLGVRCELRDTFSSKWLKYALACFIVQIIALTLIQARCILFDNNVIGRLASDFTVSEADDVWFMPGQFGASLLVQLPQMWREKGKLCLPEAFYGSLGGVANFLSTALLLLATKFALPFERGIVFPCFAVATMTLCNIWARVLYREKFNFGPNIVCSLGIFMAVSS